MTAPDPTVTVVTGFHREGFEQYGRDTIRTFLRHWPANHQLVVYHEGLSQGDLLMMPQQVDLRQPPADMRHFLARHGNNPVMKGLKPGPGVAWKSKDLRAGYSFRFDAVKFCKMAFYARDAATRLREGLMVWLDGDCVSYADVPGDLVSRSLNKADCSYLGRDPYHPDAAFTCFRLPEAAGILADWANAYDHEIVFSLPEWHSAFVLKHAIDLAARRGVKVRDLTPGGKKHVFAKAEIGRYVDHLKGERRKAQGFSEERPA